jgi:hypothetical protein
LRSQIPRDATVVRGERGLCLSGLLGHDRIATVQRSPLTE